VAFGLHELATRIHPTFFCSYEAWANRQSKNHPLFQTTAGEVGRLAQTTTPQPSAPAAAASKKARGPKFTQTFVAGFSGNTRLDTKLERAAFER
jgi:hypothetical protein